MPREKQSNLVMKNLLLGLEANMEKTLHSFMDESSMPKAQAVHIHAFVQSFFHIVLQLK